MAITGISSYDGKQIIAAGAQSAIKAYQDSNGDVITSKYQTTAGMSDYQTTAGMSDYATTASVTGKQDTLTFGYTNDQISQINGSGIYSQGGGGGSFPASADAACTVVTANSGNWNDTYSAVTANSASWATSTLPTSADNACKEVTSHSANWNNCYTTTTGNSANWNNAFNVAKVKSGYAHYSQTNNPNWWASTASNPMHVAIQTATWSSAGTVSDAHLFLTQKNANESAFHITLRIGGNWQMKGSWTQYTFATLGGSTYFCDNAVQMQYIEWSNFPVMEVKNGGWNTAATAIVFDPKTGSGITATFVWDGVVSKA